MSMPSEAGAIQLDNPAWSKANHQARTERCAQGGNKLCEASAMADDRP